MESSGKEGYSRVLKAIKAWCPLRLGFVLDTLRSPNQREHGWPCRGVAAQTARTTDKSVEGFSRESENFKGILQCSQRHGRQPSSGLNPVAVGTGTCFNIDVALLLSFSMNRSLCFCFSPFLSLSHTCKHCYNCFKIVLKIKEAEFLKTGIQQIFTRVKLCLTMCLLKDCTSGLGLCESLCIQTS